MTFDDKDPPWIALIFRSCIDTGVYPDTWKEYNMVPVHKKGDKQIINNYRPVSLLPIGMFINMRQCAVLWTLIKLRKTVFCYKIINYSLRELKFLGNMYFSCLEKVVSARAEKVLSLQRNGKNVTLLLIYHISGF